MYTVASPDPSPRDGGQLPNPNKCNSILTSGTRGVILTLTSGTSGSAAPTYIYVQDHVGTLAQVGNSPNLGWPNKELRGSQPI